MGNRELVNLLSGHVLKRDIGAWNRWREQHPDVQLDLKGINLSHTMPGHRPSPQLNHTWEHPGAGPDLSSINLSRARLSIANLSYAWLSGADLLGTNLHGANLSGTNLSEA